MDVFKSLDETIYGKCFDHLVLVEDVSIAIRVAHRINSDEMSEEVQSRGFFGPYKASNGSGASSIISWIYEGDHDSIRRSRSKVHYSHKIITNLYKCKNLAAISKKINSEEKLRLEYMKDYMKFLSDGSEAGGDGDLGVSWENEVLDESLIPYIPSVYLYNRIMEPTRLELLRRLMRDSRQIFFSIVPNASYLLLIDDFMLSIASGKEEVVDICGVDNQYILVCRDHLVEDVVKFVNRDDQSCSLIIEYSNFRREVFLRRFTRLVDLCFRYNYSIILSLLFGGGRVDVDYDIGHYELELMVRFLGEYQRHLTLEEPEVKILRSTVCVEGECVDFYHVGPSVNSKDRLKSQYPFLRENSGEVFVYKKYKSTKYKFCQQHGYIEQIYADLKVNAEAVVESINYYDRKDPPPFLYSLTSLQRDALEYYDIEPARVFEACIDLYYNYGAISYPITTEYFLVFDPEKYTKIVMDIFVELRKKKQLELNEFLIINNFDLNYGLKVLHDRRNLRLYSAEEDGAVIRSGAIIPLCHLNRNGISKTTDIVFKMIESRFFAALSKACTMQMVSVMMRGGDAQDVCMEANIQVMRDPGWFSVQVPLKPVYDRLPLIKTAKNSEPWWINDDLLFNNDRALRYKTDPNRVKEFVGSRAFLSETMRRNIKIIFNYLTEKKVRILSRCLSSGVVMDTIFYYKFDLNYLDNQEQKLLLEFELEQEYKRMVFEKLSKLKIGARFPLQDVQIVNDIKHLEPNFRIFFLNLIQEKIYYNQRKKVIINNVDNSPIAIPVERRHKVMSKLCRVKWAKIEKLLYGINRYSPSRRMLSISKFAMDERDLFEEMRFIFALLGSGPNVDTTSFKSFIEQKGAIIFKLIAQFVQNHLDYYQRCEGLDPTSTDYVRHISDYKRGLNARIYDDISVMNETCPKCKKKGTLKRGPNDLFCFNSQCNFFIPLQVRNLELDLNHMISLIRGRQVKALENSTTLTLELDPLYKKLLVSSSIAELQ